MLVTLMAALAGDRVIGEASGRIPWDHPRDRAHFRASTAGRWLLVGRRTYAEMEGWFGDRTPIILTRNEGFRPFSPAHRLARSVPAALDLARANGVPELIVCGGATVYAASLPYADRLVLTRLTMVIQVAEPVQFPDFASSGRWHLRRVEHWPADGSTSSARLEVYDRREK
jgi:dihydrofolate reductase